VDDNVVFISKDYYAEDHKRDHFTIDSCNWFSGSAPDKRTLEVKMRHGPHRHPCQITPSSDGKVNVMLNVQDQGIAAGQFAVFYDGDLCLGAGVIQ
jgi:tRNA U34 2-thiouridine synthase MnmA/TrmU